MIHSIYPAWYTGSGTNSSSIIYCIIWLCTNGIGWWYTGGEKRASSPFLFIPNHFCKKTLGVIASSMGQFLPIFGGICNKLSHEKSRQFSDVTCKKFTHTNSIMWHKNKRKKSGVAIKLLITQNGTVKPNVIAVSGSLIIAAVEKNLWNRRSILSAKFPLLFLSHKLTFSP